MTALNPNRVFVTVSASSVKLPAPADHVGTGFGADIGAYPATLPLPEPRSRRVAADPASLPPAGPPSGPTGWFSGPSVRRDLRSPTGRARVMCGRAADPGSAFTVNRLGRDCQSPDRLDGKPDQDATPRLRDWRRTERPAAAAGK